MWEDQSDWYSPTRLNSSSNTQYDFPGDRFIPNRSLMDLDQAQSLLTNRTVPNRNSNFNEAYRQILQDQPAIQRTNDQTISNSADFLQG